MTDSMVPSLRMYSQETRELLNPLLSWVKEQIDVGPGAYVGFKMKDDLKSHLEISRRKPLYPTYVLWATKRGIKPLGHVHFSNQLLEILKQEGLKVSKERRKEGIYISGIQVKCEVFTRDLLYGAPLHTDKQEEDSLSVPRSDQPITSTYQFPDKGQHPASVPGLYDRYFYLLGKTPRKEILNKVSRIYDFSVDSSLNSYLSDVKINSPEYRRLVRETMLRGITTIHRFGAIPYSYELMGTSTRIIPKSYKDSINNIKRFLREEIYIELGRVCQERFGMCIVDLDLKSCYTSILLGLYPRELEALQRAIEGEGLWNYSYKEFKKNGKEEVWNKPAVKVCVYSSFFMGGNRAMIDGIKESFRKDMGLSKKEFRECSDYGIFHTMARNVTE